MSKEIIGRSAELLELKELFNSKKSEFVALYGRRRVGKTFLVRHYFRNQQCIYFQAVGLQNGHLEVQLQNFIDSLSETFYDNMPMQAASSFLMVSPAMFKTLISRP